MDQPFFTALMDLIEANPMWLALAAFIFALLESLAIVGLIMPGIMLLFLVGALVGLDPALFLWVWLAASLGAMSGDLASYWIGRHFRERIPSLWPFHQRPELLQSGQDLVARHGGKSIFLARFIGPMRPVVPMLAGMLGQRRLIFVSFAIPACLLWAPVYLVPGMVFGASLDLAAELAGRLVALLLLGVLGVWFVAWLTRVIYDYTARRSGWWLRRLIRWTHRHPVAGRLVGDLFEPGRHQVISIALLGLLLMVGLILFVSVLIAAPFALPAWDAELQMVGLAASMRSHLADPVFVVLALAGDVRVLAALSLVIAVMLLIQRRYHALRHWLFAVAGGCLVAALTAVLMGLIVPIDATGSGFDQVPQLPFALASLIFGFFAVMVAKDLSARRRKWPYLASSLVLTALGFSQFYLGQASLLGLVAAFAFALGWLALVGIGYRRRARPYTHPVWFTAVLSASFVALTVVHVQANYQAKLDASRLVPPARELVFSAWLTSDWQALPVRRSRLGPAQQQRFDLQLEGELESLASGLLAQGWQQPPSADLVGVLRSLVAAPDAELPSLPRDFAGRPEDLLMVLALDQQQRLVMRLWDSGARLSPGARPLWLGQVRREREGLNWLGFRRWQELPDTRAQALEALLEGWPGLMATRQSSGVVLISSPDRSVPPPVPPAAPGPPGAAQGR